MIINNLVPCSKHNFWSSCVSMGIPTFSGFLTVSTEFIIRNRIFDGTRRKMQITYSSRFSKGEIIKLVNY